MYLFWLYSHLFVSVHIDRQTHRHTHVTDWWTYVRTLFLCCTLQYLPFFLYPFDFCVAAAASMCAWVSVGYYCCYYDYACVYMVLQHTFIEWMHNDWPPFARRAGWSKVKELLVKCIRMIWSTLFFFRSFMCASRVCTLARRAMNAHICALTRMRLSM